MLMMGNYDDLIEEIIKKQIELGNDKFVIYPAGKMGMLVKEVLNLNLGLKELALVDNYSFESNNDVISFDELCQKKEWYVVLLSTTTKDVKDQLIEGLKALKRPVVDIFYECDKFRGEIFDFNNPQMKIDEIDDAQMDKLFERTAEQWSKLGDSEPYWSVLTKNKYLSKNISKQYLQDFYMSGEKRCDKLINTLIRNGRIKDEQEASQLVVTEIGCGCGRVTSALAARFKHVNAYDISPGNMKIAQKYVNSNNVDFQLIKSVYDYNDIPETDVFYTVLVLQHNVPPVIRFLLTKMLGALRHDGVGFFQAPSYLKNYRFVYDEWINTQITMDMHVLPQKDIFQIIKEAGCDVLECYMDYDTGTNSGYISSTYVVRKP